MKPNNPKEKFEKDIAGCLKALNEGGLILYPTDTIWGIGCDPTNESAVDKVFALKKRTDKKAMSVLVADERDVLQYVANPDMRIFDYLNQLSKPTTVIYEGAIGLARNLTADDGTVAIRICYDIFCRHLIKRFRKPLVSTSANISGLPASKTGSAPRLAATLGTAVIVGYLVQVALYGGDFSLSYLRASTVAAQGHIAGGHGVPAYLLGRMTAEAPWYFYPVAFLYKTSIALHALIVAALAGGIMALRGADLASLLSSRTRAPLVASVAFGAALVSANLSIGFRYALPVLPLVCILVAAGAAVVWRRTTHVLRGVIAVLAVWSAVSALSYYPHFLAYTSEYQSEPELGYSVFVDSSLDWGQGLLELRDFMRDEGIESVYLSYFGSALPEGYGIDYVALPGFFPLANTASVEPPPRFAAISATNLVGMYLAGDPFAGLRNRPPYRVLGHTVFIYEVTQ